jgi:hypothetical protein
VAYNTGYIHNNMAICFKTAPDWISVNPDAGTVQPSQHATIQVVCGTAGLVPGTYTASVQIQHNDPVMTNPMIIPVSMTVTDVAVLRLLPAITGVSALTVDRAGSMLLENSIVGSPAAGKATGSRFQLFLK